MFLWASSLSSSFSCGWRRSNYYLPKRLVYIFWSKVRWIRKIINSWSNVEKLVYSCSRSSWKPDEMSSWILWWCWSSSWCSKTLLLRLVTKKANQQRRFLKYSKLLESKKSWKRSKRSLKKIVGWNSNRLY
jgi:hypothetical protein